MRRLHYEVRQPTLAELDASVSRAKTRLDEYCQSGEDVLAAARERALNRLLEARLGHAEVNSSPAE